MFENTQISDFTKIRPVGAELFHGDGETDMSKPASQFRHNRFVYRITSIGNVIQTQFLIFVLLRGVLYSVS